MANPCSRSPASPSARTVTKSGATGTVPKTGKPGWPISKMSPMRTVVATRSFLVTSPLSVFAGRSSARLVCRLSGVPIRPAVYREPLGRFPCHRPPLPVPVRPRFHQPCARLGQVPALRSRGSCLPSPTPQWSLSRPGFQSVFFLVVARAGSHPRVQVGAGSRLIPRWRGCCTQRAARRRAEPVRGRERLRRGSLSAVAELTAQRFGHAARCEAV